MKMHPRLRFMAFAAAILLSTLAGTQTTNAQTAQATYTPAPENLKAREWFQDAKFGMFIHWGVYSVLGDGEWVMETRPIRGADYAKLPAFFNPIKFDPAAWVSLARAAGMKYITITSKHHDGFAMFDSKVSDWDIVDRTPYKKDVLKMLADECHRQGVKLFFYHSQLDWHHPDYYPPGRNTAGFNDQSEIGDLPLETCETMNNAWGFNITDRAYKSTKDLVRYLVRAAGNDANFLLNVGPMPNGKIQPEFVSRLKEMGDWLSRYGESIYGTRGGPVTPRPWGVTTQKGTTVDLHVLDWPDETLSLPKLPGKVTGARFVKDGSRAAFVDDEAAIRINIPACLRDETDAVVALTYQLR